jgi:hypothetical protein
MITNAEADRDGLSVTVRVPLTFAGGAGRKQVVSPRAGQGPPGTAIGSRRRHAGEGPGSRPSLAGHAGGWRVRLIEELARAEKINPSYLARVLRLTLLAPEIVETILDGRHDPERDHARAV